jgi:ACR3 family arsenite transporter
MTTAKTDGSRATNVPPGSPDLEKQQPPHSCGETHDVEHNDDKFSAFKGLGWLDRFLAVWIFLAMLIGILLGNFVPSTARVLQRGEFVGVSVPIGE